MLKRKKKRKILSEVAITTFNFFFSEAYCILHTSPPTPGLPEVAANLLPLHLEYPDDRSGNPQRNTQLLTHLAISHPLILKQPLEFSDTSIVLLIWNCPHCPCVHHWF